jgi:hypothetical protein
MICTDEDRSHVNQPSSSTWELLAKIPANAHLRLQPARLRPAPTPKPAPVMTWTDRMMEWMEERGIMPAAK